MAPTKERLAQMNREFDQLTEDEASGKVPPVYPDLPEYVPIPTLPGQVVAEIRTAPTDDDKDRAARLDALYAALTQIEKDEASGKVPLVYPDLPLYVPIPTRPGEVLVEIRPAPSAATSKDGPSAEWMEEDARRQRQPRT